MKIDYLVESCGEEPNTISEFNFIRLTNKTNADINVSFKIEYYYNGNCTTCGDDGYLVNYRIPANSSISTNCNELSGQYGKLAVINKYKNRNYGSPLDKFEISNIEIK